MSLHNSQIKAIFQEKAAAAGILADANASLECAEKSRDEIMKDFFVFKNENSKSTLAAAEKCYADQLEKCDKATSFESDVVDKFITFFDEWSKSVKENLKKAKDAFETVSPDSPEHNHIVEELEQAKFEANEFSKVRADSYKAFWALPSAAQVQEEQERLAMEHAMEYKRQIKQEKERQLEKSLLLEKARQLGEARLQALKEAHTAEEAITVGEVEVYERGLAEQVKSAVVLLMEQGMTEEEAMKVLE